MSEHFLLAVGTQTGVNFGGPLEEKGFATLSYANAVFSLPRPHAHPHRDALAQRYDRQRL